MADRDVPPWFFCVLLLLSPVCLCPVGAQLLFGCRYEPELCIEDVELCVDDGLFGQCQSQPLGPPVQPDEFDADALALVGGRLEELVDAGESWRSASVQCQVAYFMFAARNDIAYDEAFCDVNDPEQIWRLIHTVQGHLPLVEQGEPDAEEEEEVVLEAVPVLLQDDQQPIILDEDDLQQLEEPDLLPAPVEKRSFDGVDYDEEQDEELPVVDDAEPVYQVVEVLDPSELDEADYLEGSPALEGDYDDDAEGTPVLLLDDEQLQQQPEMEEELVPVYLEDDEEEEEEQPEVIQVIPVELDVESPEDVQEALEALQQMPDEQLPESSEVEVLSKRSDDFDDEEPEEEEEEQFVAIPVEIVDDDDDDQENESLELTPDEHVKLREMLVEIMNGEEPDMSELDDEQINKFISYIELMKAMISAQQTPDAGDYEPVQITEGAVVPAAKRDDDELYDDNNEDVVDDYSLQPIGEIVPIELPDNGGEGGELFKKDIERIGDVDQGLDNVEHKLVKGWLDVDEQPLEHIEGNRFYLKLKENLDESDAGKLADLIDYLQSKIAAPKNVSFVDFSVDGHMISFRVVPNEVEVDYEYDNDDGDVKAAAQKKMAPVDDLPDFISAHTKDVANSVGYTVVENGRGDPNGVHFASAGGWQQQVLIPLVLTALALCATAVLSVCAVFVYRRRSDIKQNVQRLAADIESRPSKAYEELCRQRMSGKGEPPEPLSASAMSTAKQRIGSQNSSPTNRHGSSSSWSEEPVLNTNMDVSTGHMILEYLEAHLRNADKLDEEWANIALYQPDLIDSTVADAAENKPKNRNKAVVPYDHARVKLQSILETDGTGYINASPICDADPRAPIYVAAQAPTNGTAGEFWQMIWEQGSVVIVNLTLLNENGSDQCHRYWPDNGSEVHGIFEVHLVSEHIWCEDYLVRSFYLKNLRTAETRTVTQLHFVGWKEAQTPPSAKSLLEFRRKVNKSYRGRASPIIVHCSDGAGRTGTYILLDMVLNRISKGVKEMDIAATLEHLRDQRMGLVGNKAQYQFVLQAVALEVQAIVSALAAQP